MAFFALDFFAEALVVRGSLDVALEVLDAFDCALVVRFFFDDAVFERGFPDPDPAVVGSFEAALVVRLGPMLQLNSIASDVGEMLLGAERTVYM